MFRALTLSILMALVSYALLEDAGIAKTFNEAVGPLADAVVKPNHVIKFNRMIKFEIVEYYKVSLMNDPNGEGIKVYKGAMKKSALDRMEYIGLMHLDFYAGVTDSIVRKVIVAIAAKHGANVAIIDIHTTKSIIVDSTDGRE